MSNSVGVYFVSERHTHQEQDRNDKRFKKLTNICRFSFRLLLFSILYDITNFWKDTNGPGNESRIIAKCEDGYDIDEQLMMGSFWSNSVYQSLNVIDWHQRNNQTSWAKQRKRNQKSLNRNQSMAGMLEKQSFAPFFNSTVCRFLSICSFLFALPWNASHLIWIWFGFSFTRVRVRESVCVYLIIVATCCSRSIFVFIERRRRR